MSIFMNKYIERIVNVKGDGNCNFRLVFALLDKGGEDHTFFRQLINELTGPKESYTRLYGKKRIFQCNL